jgi:23S rRNA pseudouridine955/2504/2580 synthase
VPSKNAPTLSTRIPPRERISDMKKVQIKKNDANQRIDKFLSKTFPSLPGALIYKYIRKKYIKLNGKRCKADQKLNFGDELQMYIKDEFFRNTNDKYNFLKAADEIDITYEDQNILLINKKPGLLVHPDCTERFDSLIARLQKYLYKKKEYLPESENSFAPALANRIDRNTSGIVLAAKNAEALKILSEKIKNREIKKFYLCLCEGFFEKKEGILTGFLKKDCKNNKVYVSKHKTEFSKKIETKYRVLKKMENSSLLEIELLTGRTHQIRAHLAFVGHPILGDGKYGKTSGKYRWQALCSYRTIFDFKTDAGILNYLNKKEIKLKNIWFSGREEKILP